ncbi:MAG TPA: hypothetical protein VHY09_04420, partial [Candidatus Methylacidiphilales bacterium]|nr:hypothetical protein [Candidatus Methylacidiphilales bacterium]
MPASPMAVQTEPRGTQSFVHIIAACWRRPSLLALELLWRWCFGLPLLALLGWEGWQIWSQSASRLQATGVQQFSLQSPMQGALSVAAAFAVLRPPVIRVLAWLLPAAIFAWALAAGLGRNLVLRRYDRRLPWRPVAMVLLQLLRVTALCATFAAWFVAIHWAAAYSLAPGSISAEAGGEPNLVLYCALVILFSLGIFTFWLLLSWTFSIAPLLALLERRSIGASLLRTLRLGPLAGKLVEINLVMG